MPQTVWLVSIDCYDIDLSSFKGKGHGVGVLLQTSSLPKTLCNYTVLYCFHCFKFVRTQEQRRIFRKCTSGVCIFQVVDKCLRDGWSGNQRNKHGILISILNSDTKNLTEQGWYMNDISFLNNSLKLRLSLWKSVLNITLRHIKIQSYSLGVFFLCLVSKIRVFMSCRQVSSCLCITLKPTSMQLYYLAWQAQS